MSELTTPAIGAPGAPAAVVCKGTLVSTPVAGLYSRHYAACSRIGHERVSRVGGRQNRRHSGWSTSRERNRRARRAREADHRVTRCNRGTRPALPVRRDVLEVCCPARGVYRRKQLVQSVVRRCNIVRDQAVRVRCISRIRPLLPAQFRDKTYWSSSGKERYHSQP